MDVSRHRGPAAIRLDIKKKLFRIGRANGEQLRYDREVESEDRRPSEKFLTGLQ